MYKLPPAPDGTEYIVSSVYGPEDRIAHLVMADGSDKDIEKKRPLCKQPMQHKRPIEPKMALEYQRRICQGCARTLVAKRAEQRRKLSRKPKAKRGEVAFTPVSLDTEVSHVS